MGRSWLKFEFYVLDLHPGLFLVDCFCTNRPSLTSLPPCGVAAEIGAGVALNCLGCVLRWNNVCSVHLHNQIKGLALGCGCP